MTCRPQVLGIDSCRAAVRGAEEACELHRSLRVEEAGALRQHVIGRIDLRGVLQDRLHHVRRQRRVGLQHQRDGSAHHRRRHAGTRQAQIRLVAAAERALQQVLRLAVVHRAARGRQRNDARARRDEIRLRLEVDRRRTARAVTGHHVVGTRHGAFVAVRAHGQHPGSVAGGGDRAVLRLPVSVLPEVAGRSDDDDAGVDDALGRERQRVGLEGLGDRRADRQVHDAHVVGRPVRDHPVERGDDVADDAAAAVVEHLQAHDMSRRRHPGANAERLGAVAADDAGHVRPMAVVVVRRRPPVDEVDERGDALPVLDADGRRRPGVGQVVMPVGDARVDHGDTDARAGIPVGQLGRARASSHGDAVHLPPGRTVVVSALHEGQVRELAEDRVREFDHLPVDQSQLPSEAAAKLADVRRGIGP